MTPSPHYTWSVIVFGYNEVETVAQVIDQAGRVLDKISRSPAQIIAVDDGSDDDMDRVLADLARLEVRLEVIRHETNRGIGAALHSGYRQAQGERVVAVPADGQFDLDELIPYGDLPDETVLSFYRRENLTYSPLRNGLSWINKQFNQWAVGLSLKDVNWVKVYPGRELSELNLEVKSSLVESEICGKLDAVGCDFIEVPSQYLVRTAGVSKGASLKIVGQAVSEMVHLAQVVRRFRRKVGRSQKKSR